MTTVADIQQFINQLAPPTLAESWDNVGLLVGDPRATVQRMMTCLTITPDSAEEAIANQADVVVTHHPLPFRPIQRLTADQTAGRLLLQLIKSDVAVISPHTAFDSAVRGINAQLAMKFQLSDARPLVPAIDFSGQAGAARVAEADPGATVTSFIEKAKSCFGLPQVRYVGQRQQPVTRVAFGCGSGGSFLEQAIEAGCDMLITGEASFHTCLEARAQGVALLLLGHHTSERFALESLAATLAERFSKLNVWASQLETDPVQTI